MFADMPCFWLAEISVGVNLASDLSGKVWGLLKHVLRCNSFSWFANVSTDIEIKSTDEGWNFVHNIPPYQIAKWLTNLWNLHQVSCCLIQITWFTISMNSECHNIYPVIFWQLQLGDCNTSLKSNVSKQYLAGVGLDFLQDVCKTPHNWRNISFQASGSPLIIKSLGKAAWASYAPGISSDIKMVQEFLHLK